MMGSDTDGTSQDTGSHFNDLPAVLTVEELQAILRIGRRQAYELCKRPDFPAVRVGRSIRIPKKALQEWMQSEADGAPYENPLGWANA